MTPSHSTRGKAKRYRYYVCSSAQKRGWQTCPSKAIPADQVEGMVVSQIRTVGRDPTLVREVLEQAKAQAETAARDREAARANGARKTFGPVMPNCAALSGQVQPGRDNAGTLARLADLQERIAAGEARVRALSEEVEEPRLTDDEARHALALFDPVWEALTLRERARAVHLLVERVDYDGAKGQAGDRLPAGRHSNAGSESGRTFTSSGSLLMTTPLTVECEVHFTNQKRGRKVLEVGPAPGPSCSPGRLPRVTRWMALAIRCDELIRSGVIENYAAIARLGHVTRARVSQIMNLLNLAPDIQEALLELPRVMAGREPVVLAELQPIASVVDWREQRRMWEEMHER